MVKVARVCFLTLLLLWNDAGRADEEDAYRIVNIPTPEGVAFEIGGLETLSDGRLAAAIRKGEVWTIANVYADPPNPIFKRIAEALHEPLGLLQHEGALYTAQRGELTRLSDLDGDGTIDEYRTVSDDWGVSGNYHEYAYGPAVDATGNFWVTLNQTLGKKIVDDDAWRGWGVRITPAGELVPSCAGMRSPCGIGKNAEGDLFFTDQQGNWVAAGSLHQLRDGAFYGHPDSFRSCSLEGSPLKRPKKVPDGIPWPEALKQVPQLCPPAVWFPYRKVGMSATDIVCDQTGGKFGPFANQLFVGDFTTASISRVFLEKVNGEYQGACFPFRSGFQSAVVRMSWGKEGSLFCGETNRGWNSRGSASFGLDRLVWSGRTPFEIRQVRARSDGFELVFTLPVDPETAADPSSYEIESYTYLYHSKYGGEEIEKKSLDIREARLGPDGRSLSLAIDGMREGYVHEIRARGVRSKNGTALVHPDAYYTLNAIPRS